jgi:hypothetical protein
MCTEEGARESQLEEVHRDRTIDHSVQLQLCLVSKDEITSTIQWYL